MAVTTRDVAAIQRYFPQIYLACHTRHRRRRSHPAQLTAHDSSLLAHLSAMQASSVLDSERLAALLARLTSTERTRAVEGLRLLAEAALSLRKKEIA